MQTTIRCPHSGAPTTLPALAARYGLPLSLVEERHARGRVGTELISEPPMRARIDATAARASKILQAAQSPLACPMQHLGTAPWRQQVSL